MKNLGATLVRGKRIILAEINNFDTYINDFIMHTNDWQAHLQVLGELLRHLRKAGFTAKPFKCVFKTESAEFLGHFISRGWITINEDNLEKIAQHEDQLQRKRKDRFGGQQTITAHTFLHLRRLQCH